MPLPRRAFALSLAGLGLAVARGAGAQAVSMQGTLGDSKALLVINGTPVTLAVGASAQGVTLRALRAGQAEIEVGGRRQLLSIGSAPVSVGGGGPASSAAREIVLAAGPGGHFVTQGTINGRAVRFLLDTGATTVSMSQAEAERIGLDWKRGERAHSQTAGGVVPIHMLNLTSVRVGEVEVYNVGASVLQAEMPVVLLGNTFLSRFSMERRGDTLRLTRSH